MDNTIPSKRLVGLDLLRIALSVIVLAFHSNIHFVCTYGPLNQFVCMGAVAMTGFFMLSGFSLLYTYEGKHMLR